MGNASQKRGHLSCMVKGKKKRAPKASLLLYKIQTRRWARPFRGGCCKDGDFLALHWVGGEREDAMRYSGQPSSPGNPNHLTLRSRKETRDVEES